MQPSRLEGHKGQIVEEEECEKRQVWKATMNAAKKREQGQGRAKEGWRAPKEGHVEQSSWVRIETNEMAEDIEQSTRQKEMPTTQMMNGEGRRAGASTSELDWSKSIWMKKEGGGSPQQTSNLMYRKMADQSRPATLEKQTEVNAGDRDPANQMRYKLQSTTTKHEGVS